jgi:hypothetical protein
MTDDQAVRFAAFSGALRARFSNPDLDLGDGARHRRDDAPGDQGTRGC